MPLLEAYFRRAPSEMPDELAMLFAAHGLTARHGAVLAQLSAGRSISVTDLARRLNVSLSTASELVGELSRAGLVERQEDPGNRRRTLVDLAEAHRDVVRSFVAQRAVPLLKVLDGLAPRDREGFARGLAAWAREVRNW
ncbi:MarR family winged helix-turn-helix transcriptional regulator [Geodermatophilus sp. URMC 60]